MEDQVTITKSSFKKREARSMNRIVTTDPDMEPGCFTQIIVETTGKPSVEKLRNKLQDSKRNKRGGSEILIGSMSSDKPDKRRGQKWWSSSELSIESSTADKAIKSKLERAADDDDVDDDRLAVAVTSLHHADVKIEDNPLGLAAESQIRFLKTKIRVLQEDVERLFQDNHNLMKENANLEKTVKELAELKSQLQNEVESEQQLSVKYYNLYEDAKTQITALVSESTTLKKDLDTVSKVQLHTSSTQLSVETRLNKAMEQIEKYKMQIEKAEQRHKEATAKERKKVEDLSVENARLHKQKADLLLGFKKQMVLIDVLKRQKIHFEAASVLKFTEDEFLKLINWNSESS